MAKKKRPSDTEDMDKSIKLRDRLDYQQLVYKAIENIITAPTPEMYVLRVSHLQNMLWCWKDSEFENARKDLFKKHEDDIKILSIKSWRDRLRMQNLEILRAQTLLRLLLELADRLKLLGEKEKEEEI